VDEALSKRPLALAASSTTWRRSSVPDRRPASWTIWHCQLMCRCTKDRVL
jgi:hypothetical protein